jgi:hypothetical protein
MSYAVTFDELHSIYKFISSNYCGVQAEYILPRI